MKSNRSARMNAMHFRVLTARYFRQIFTNPGIFLPLLLEAPILLILLIVVCKADSFTLKAVTDANTVIFLLVVMSALMGILNSYREICKEREVLAREVFGGLDVNAYALSKFVVLAVFGAGRRSSCSAGRRCTSTSPSPRPRRHIRSAGWRCTLPTSPRSRSGCSFPPCSNVPKAPFCPFCSSSSRASCFRTACSCSAARRDTCATSRPRRGARRCWANLRG